MNIVRNILVFLFISFTPLTYSQTVDYAIYSGDLSIGTVTAYKTISGDTMKINVISKVKTRLFVDINITYQVSCIYINNILNSSHCTSYENGNLHSSSSIARTANGYSIIVNGKPSTYNDDICYSGSLLYFKKPKDINAVFSEFEGINKTVTEISANHFQTVNPKNGHINDYYYGDILLLRAKIRNTLMTFTLKQVSVD